MNYILFLFVSFYCGYSGARLIINGERITGTVGVFMILAVAYLSSLA